MERGVNPFFSRWLPSVSWLAAYQREDLRGDVSAGATTAVMLIPQGMAYAMLAGLPPVVGLYASMIPLVLYGLLGSSRQLAVGPVAMDSILVAQGVAPLAGGDPELYLALATASAAIVGALQLGMGVMRLGFLVQMLSNPVVTGFASAAALIIGFSQLSQVLGVSLPRSSNIFEIGSGALSRYGEWHWPTIGIAIGAFLLLVGLKRWRPNFPRALAVVVLGTGLVFALRLDEMGDQGVNIVGAIPAGLPEFQFPELHSIVELVPISVTIALIGFLEAISVGKALAKNHGYRLDPNRELIALGSSNLGASLFGGYPVTGGFSRSAVNDQAGARTPLAGLVTAALVACALLFLTPLFFFLPKAALAAIIMSAVFGLVDIAELRRLWNVKRLDFGLAMLTFLATLSFGIQIGIGVGVLASMSAIVWDSARPHFAVLGELPDEPGVYRNIRRYPEAITTPGLLLVRVDAPFHFANADYLRGVLHKEEAKHEEKHETPLRAVVLDLSGVNQLDSSAATALEELLEAYRARDVELILAQAKGPVRDVLEGVGLKEKLGSESMPLTLPHAIRAIA